MSVRDSVYVSFAASGGGCGLALTTKSTNLHPGKSKRVTTDDAVCSPGSTWLPTSPVARVGVAVAETVGAGRGPRDGPAPLAPPARLRTDLSLCVVLAATFDSAVAWWLEGAVGMAGICHVLCSLSPTI